MQWVFALGKLGYDFGTEARRDSIRQHMQQPAPGFDPNPHDPAQLLSYLQDNSWEAAAIIWTLNLDATPIYAIKSCGAFAREIYERLRDFLHQQLDNAVERVSIPGRIAGNVRLMNGQVVPVIQGQVVPVIQPDRRGMYSWRTDQLIDLVSKELGYSESEQDELARCKERVGNFFVRAYEELRNLGISPQDRALNLLRIGRSITPLLMPCWSHKCSRKLLRKTSYLASTRWNEVRFVGLNRIAGMSS